MPLQITMELKIRSEQECIHYQIIIIIMIMRTLYENILRSTKTIYLDSCGIIRCLGLTVQIEAYY